MALTGAGSVLAYVVGDAERGAALLDRALALNPNDALAWLFRGWTFVWLGDSEKAIDRFMRAMRLSPLDPSLIQVSPEWRTRTFTLRDTTRPLLGPRKHFESAQVALRRPALRRRLTR